MSPDLVHGYVNDLLDGHYWGHPLVGGESQGAYCGGPHWFGQANVLLLTRDRGKSVRLSTDAGVPGSTVLSTDDVAVGWNEGLEFRLGRFIGCGDYAIEGAWWTMFRQRRQASVFGATLAGNLDSVIDFGELDFDQGGLVANVNDWYTGSEVHRVRRGFEAHSVELNLLGFLTNGCATQCGTCDPCGHSFKLGWNLGFRYFRISEDLHFDTDDTNRTFGDPLGEVFYNIDIDNNLIGFQLGGNASYSFTSRLLATLDARVGLYGNYVQHSSSVIGCTIGPAVVNTGYHLGEAALVSTNEVDASMAFELKLGTMYRISDHWTTDFGYRAVAISGLALPDDQIPFRFGDLQTIQNVNTHAAMILHGFNLGFEFWY
jgi:opacity protein-like surface antigen